MSLVTAALDIVGRTLWHISVQASVLIGLARLCVPLSLSLPVGLMDEVRTSGRRLRVSLDSIIN